MALVEFERLRDEVDGRTQLGYGLVALELTALGTGLSVFEVFPDVVLGLTVVSTLLWLIWIDQVSQIYKLRRMLT